MLSLFPFPSTKDTSTQLLHNRTSLPTVSYKIVSIRVFYQSHAHIFSTETSLSRPTSPNPIESPTYVSVNVLSNISQPSSQHLQNSTSIPMSLLPINPIILNNPLTTDIKHYFIP